MGRLLVLLLLPLLGAAQQTQDQQFQQAGVCGRCHVISVVEWGISGHQQAATDCIACHGPSQGHIADERNNVKPERIPAGAAIAGLCATCHGGGCPKTKQTASCQTCHHVHALVDPNKPPVVRDDELAKKEKQWELFARHMDEGGKHYSAGCWRQARDAFRAALSNKPTDRLASKRLRACERRLAGALPGFEIVNEEYDGDTGLPREVRVSGLGISMLLVPGGEFEMGSDRFSGAKPVHTASVEPFYLARYELTQAEWHALMGGAAPKDGRIPVTQVSWDDAQTFLRRLNERVPGGGFRLPTEAEWEFAARAGAEVDAALEGVAWFGDSGRDAAPQPVGTKRPNKLGVYDMQGNVWEWCSSVMKPYPYDAGDGREAPDASGLRVLRGGGFIDTPDLLDPALRHSARPARRLRWNGIRLARSAPER